MKSFTGFIQSDFSAFVDKKIESSDFNQERKVVWQKMKTLQFITDSKLKERGFPLQGKISLYNINYVKRKVIGIWVAYTDIKPYYRVCQLNYGIYNNVFFIGIELNWKSKEQVKNMTDYIRSNPHEFLEHAKKLNPHYALVCYDKLSIDPNNASDSDLKNLLKTIDSKESWFEFGEWYPKTESILKGPDIVPEIIRVFETLYPLYLVFSGLRPIGSSKLDKLQRINKVLEKDLEQAENDIAPDIQQLSKQDRDELIAKIDYRNNTEYVPSFVREAKSFRRDPALSTLLKQNHHDRCQICKKAYNLEQGFFCDTHHIKPLKDGGKDTSENILVVCPNHHRLLDRSYTEVISKHKTKIKIIENGKILEIKLE